MFTSAFGDDMLRGGAKRDVYERRDGRRFSDNTS